MALQPMIREQRVSYLDVLRVVLIIAVLIALMAVLTWVFGVNRSAPSYEIVPDSLRLLPF
jgi:hypothetical protein